MQPKTVTVAQVKMMEHKRDFDPLFGLLSTIFGSWPQVLRAFDSAGLVCGQFVDGLVRGQFDHWRFVYCIVRKTFRTRMLFFSTVSVFNF